jgi:chromate reductase, NAD(P)H dehydrogenase (quinone)
MSHIKIIIASNGQNLGLAEQFHRELVSQGSPASILDLLDLDLPLYRPDLPLSPEVIPELVADLVRAKGFLILAPEYNGGIPPSLNNFIAWVSRSGDDFRACFNGKPVGLGSFSGSGSNVLQMMRLQMAYLGANVIGRQLMVNHSKPANPDSIQAMVSELRRLV